MNRLFFAETTLVMEQKLAVRAPGTAECARLPAETEPAQPQKPAQFAQPTAEFVCQSRPVETMLAMEQKLVLIARLIAEHARLPAETAPVMEQKLAVRAPGTAECALFFAGTICVLE